MAVLVFGSINMDLVARTPRLPQAGETLMGHSFSTSPGGKGANQAVAVARLGTPVTMIGRVGDDPLGKDLISSLSQVGVDCDRISTVPETSSGVAVIEVDDQGENHIIVVPGANAWVNPDDVKSLKQCCASSRILLLQLEVPLPGVVAAAQAASEQGLMVVLDPAPAHTDLPNELLKAVSILTPNQVEASQLVGFSVETLDDARRAADILYERGPNVVVVKLGQRGSVCVTSDEVIHTPSFPVDVVDTVAAGDAFNGGMAVALAEGRTLRDSLSWGTAVAALAITRPGAQSAMPTRDELHVFFNARA